MQLQKKKKITLAHTELYKKKANKLRTLEGNNFQITVKLQTNY